MESCVKKWIRLSDTNYKTALEWYRGCAELADNMPKRERDRYTTVLIENLKHSSDEYLPRTSLPAEALAGLEKDLSDMVEALLYPADLIKKLSLKLSWPRKSKQDSAADDMDSLNHALDYLFIAGFISFILTCILFIIMCCYCWRYKVMRDREKAEISALLEGKKPCVAGRCGCPKYRVTRKEGKQQKEDRESDEDADIIAARMMTLPFNFSQNKK